MRRVRFLVGMLTLALTLTSALTACQNARPTQAQSRPVVIAQVQGPISTTTADYLRRVLNLALREKAQAVVITLDTPGGALSATQTILEMLRASPVPVIVYISPRGAMAGSAGTLITLAAHRAYMAPETVIGAATPISMGGDTQDPVLQDKITNITVALARTLAEDRGAQAVQLAAAMVQEARAVTATEAMNAGLVDGVVPDLDALLAILDGQTIPTAQGEVTLHTADAPLRPVRPLPLERLLALITHPNIVLLLLSLGVQFLIIEAYSPGGWAAGAMGAVLLGLGLYGLGILPSNGLGLWFLALAFVLFVLEVKAPTHGALAVAGSLAFIAGGWVLFNTPLTLPQQRLSPWWAAALAAGMAGASGLSWRVLHQAQARPVLLGTEEAQRLIGRVGLARTSLQPGQRGSVRVAGETWSAVLAPGAPPVAPGQPVQVLGRRGLVLVVQGLDEPAAHNTEMADGGPS